MFVCQTATCINHEDYHLWLLAVVSVWSCKIRIISVYLARFYILSSFISPLCLSPLSPPTQQVVEPHYSLMRKSPPFLIIKRWMEDTDNWRIGRRWERARFLWEQPSNHIASSPSQRSCPLFLIGSSCSCSVSAKLSEWSIMSMYWRRSLLIDAEPRSSSFFCSI